MVKRNLKAKYASKTINVPPVVTVLGHVDHGKTSLLDSIRKTDIAKKETAGITQKIGASSVETVFEGTKRIITFIDTPGHEAFSAMRSRGARVCDVALLVVSAVDGVMPQTKESIKILQESQTPFIAVLTKSDLPNKNIRMVKDQLTKEGVLLEGLGGNVPVLEVSAKTNFHIKELLDLIILVFDTRSQSQEEEQDEEFKGVVIESYLDSRKGPVATIVVKSGTLSLRDEIVIEEVKGKVKTLMNDRGENVDRAGVGEAVEVLGMENVVQVGGFVLKKDSSKKSAQSLVSLKKSLDPKLRETAVIKVILRADTLGSLEAITGLLPDLVFVIDQKTGEITEGDIGSAKSSGAIIIGFNTKIRKNVKKLALDEKVLIRNYTIIYELIDELKDAVEGKRLQEEERILGVSKVLAKFPFEKTFVMGISVQDGRIAKGDRVRLIRNDEIIGESNVISVRKGKESISKTEKGGECGVVISPFLDFTIGDMLISHG
ncbi:MAG: GTP-binding protein [Patescibacteria group bacterium]|nr:GTP-binding protein [Patescibacteria group bacterium]